METDIGVVPALDEAVDRGRVQREAGVEVGEGGLQVAPQVQERPTRIQCLWGA